LTKRKAVARWFILVIVLVLVAAFSILALDFISTQAGNDQNSRIQSLESTVTSLQNQLTELQNRGNISSAAINTSIGNLDSVAIYKQDYRSVVTIKASKVTTVNSFFGPIKSIENLLGSGFVIRYNNSLYIVANFHVDGTVNDTVTFGNGNDYQAKVIGADPYADLAVVTVEAPSSEFQPLTIASSSFVQVGQPVLAIGNPFGLSGSITVGIISQTGRTLQ
jgi:S1-C subfamily serine protease